MNFSFIPKLKTALRLALNKLRLSIWSCQTKFPVVRDPLRGVLTGAGEPAPSATLLQDGSFTVSRIGGKYVVLCRYWCQYWADDVGVL